MLSEKEILEKIEYYQKKSDELLKECELLEYGSPKRNLNWTSSRCYDSMAMALRAVLEID